MTTPLTPEINSTWWLYEVPALYRGLTPDDLHRFELVEDPGGFEEFSQLELEELVEEGDAAERDVGEVSW